MGIEISVLYIEHVLIQPAKLGKIGIIPICALCH